MLIATAMLAAVVAAAPIAKPPPELSRTFAPHDAVREASIDAGSLGPVEAPHFRYFHTLDVSPEFKGAFDYVLNLAVSHSPNIYRSEVVAGGRVLRVDLRRLTPEADDYARLVKILESLAGVDPYFHVQGVRKVAPYKASDGKTYDFIVGSDIALHTGPESHLLLCTLTGSAAPILRADWLIVKATSVLDGGIYYKLRNIESKPAKGTAEEAFHRSLGVDQKLIRELGGESRIGMWRRDVTQKPAAIEFVQATNVPLNRGGSSILFVTRDYFNGKIDGKRQAMKNLLSYSYDGSEQIGNLSNGMPVYALFDANGNLVDEAPPNLVSDDTIPHGNTKNLQSAISCVRCHASEEGYRSARNDVELITSGKFAIDIFDDESSGRDPAAAIDELKSLYHGKIDGSLRTARTTHALATFRATGGMKPGPVAEKVGEIYNAYVYGDVTPMVACAEAGYFANAENAADILNEICPILPPNASGVSPESAMIASLRAWTKEEPVHIPRTEWEQEAADFLLRVKTAANLREAAK